MSANEYPGGKSIEGVYQTIINQIPPHDTFIDCFVGMGGILRNIAPAERNIGIEIDPITYAAWEGEGLGHLVLNMDALHFLTEYRNAYEGERVFCYLDPPYLRSVRSYQKEKIYRHEFDTPEQHAKLLELITHMPANWMMAISHYQCKQYDQALKGWRRIEYKSPTHAGYRIDSLYMNYAEPVELHDYRYLGSNFREREKIRRQQRRWKAKLQNMPALQRYALLSAVRETWNR